MTSTITDRVYGESASVAVKAPCLSVSVGPLALSGLGAVGSYSPNPGDRILVKDQTDPTANGIYNASTGAWARSGDFDGIYDAVQGTLIVVFFPNSQATIFQLTTPNAIIGTTPLAFVSFVNPNQTYPQTPQEAAVGVVPVNTTYPSQNTIRRYGALLDGVTDDSAAMILAAAVGGRIMLDGPMAMASASLAALGVSGITLKSGTTIRGQVGSPITITGSTACNVFRSTDQSDVYFIDCYFIGNNVGTATMGYLWQIVGTAAAVKTAMNWRFIRGGAENFAGRYWIYLDNTAATTYAMDGFLCDGGSRFVSKAGNCQGNTDIQITASVFGFSGSDTILTFYSMKNCIVRNCIADGQFIKNFCYFWSGTFRCKAHGNTLNGFGTDASISNDVGSYAIAVYDHSHGAGLLPDEIEIYDNLIDLVRDCGVYDAGANRLTVVNNRVSGQTSTANSVIPKGAFAFNSPNFLTFTGNKIYNSAIGVSLTQDPANTWARMKDNVIEAIPTNGIGMQLSGTTGGNAPDIGVDGISIVAAAGATGVKGIYLVFTATVGCNNLDIQNYDITACANAMQVFAPDSSVPNMGNVRIGNGKHRRITGNNLQWLNGTNAAQRLILENISFLDMQAGAVGLFVQSAVGCNIRGITFSDMTSGATQCWYAGGAQGHVSNVQFINCATANRYDGSANRMGVDVPTWTGNDNDFVQDLNPNELGSAASKYVRLGWTWDRVAAAWKECRSLTGN